MATKEKHKQRSASGYSAYKARKDWWFFNSGKWSSLVAGRRKAMQSAKS